MKERAQGALPIVGVVGPCGAGKSTLVAALSRLGIPARHIAQEHSHVPDMWARLTRPDVLIFLDADYATCTARRNLYWTPREYAEQQHRLAHARRHAHIYVATDPLTPDEVLRRVLAGLRDLGYPLPEQARKVLAEVHPRGGNQTSP